MAHSLSAKKRHRQNITRRALNRARRTSLSTEVRKFRDRSQVLLEAVQVERVAGADHQGPFVEERVVLVQLDHTVANGNPFHASAVAPMRQPHVLLTMYR